IEDSSGELKLSYVVDASKPTLDLISSQLNKNGVEYCTDYERALRSDKVDAVHIALPNKIHYEIACSALEAGKHVLLEKPMALSSREAFKLARMAEERGLVLQVGHIFRFNNALRRVRAILKSGTIGRIFYAKL